MSARPSSLIRNSTPRSIPDDVLSEIARHLRPRSWRSRSIFYDCYQSHEARDIEFQNTLLNLANSSRRLNAIARPHLYHQPMPQNVTRFLLLAETIGNNSRIRNLVRSLVLVPPRLVLGDYHGENRIFWDIAEILLRKCTSARCVTIWYNSNVDHVLQTLKRTTHIKRLILLGRDNFGPHFLTSAELYNLCIDHDSGRTNTNLGASLTDLDLHVYNYVPGSDTTLTFGRPILPSLSTLRFCHSNLSRSSLQSIRTNRLVSLELDGVCPGNALHPHDLVHYISQMQHLEHLKVVNITIGAAGWERGRIGILNQIVPRLRSLSSLTFSHDLATADLLRRDAHPPSLTTVCVYQPQHPVHLLLHLSHSGIREFMVRWPSDYLQLWNNEQDLIIATLRNANIKLTVI